MSGIETTFETTFESKSGGRPQRMDVIPAGAARRMWAPDAKARIVEESFVAGANIAAVARANDLLPQQLYAWRHTVLKAREMAFVPVVVDEPGPMPPSGSTAAEIVIHAGAIAIHVPENVTTAHIERVLIAMRQTA
ncbi:MAG: transposase [Dokdonella sp.]